MATNHSPIPVYTTRGDLGAFLVYPYLYNPQGEWIGWVTPNRSVYSVQGYYVGELDDHSPRILRKRSYDFAQPHRNPPPPPEPIRPPAHVPLPPQMPELNLSTVDVLDEAPELLPTVDFGELRQDIE